MENLSQHLLPLAGLLGFHLIFFRRFYFINPYTYARSEPLEHEFPSSRLLGENLRRGKFAFHDPYFWGDFNAQPINASFYPPHMVQAWIGSFLPLDKAWILYSAMMVFHYLLASIFAYTLFNSLKVSATLAFFGAVTLTHFSYCIKQNSSIAYTLTWLPLLLLGSLSHSTTTFGISLGMIILAGYWPLGIYMGVAGCLAWLCF